MSTAGEHSPAVRGPDKPAPSSDGLQARIEVADAVDGPINILIVDDEPGNLVVLETVLDDPGYRLVRAQSADQALLALVEEEFALLILDIRMPGMTGFELAQMIKERKKTAYVPIIFLTAYYDKDQHELEGYGTGAVDYLNKPFNPAVLRSKVSVFADLHRKNRTIQLANRALTTEVAERRRAEEQLRELNETLERRVTERTEALRQSDDKLSAMLNSITDGLLTLDAEWRCTSVNAQGARLLGKQPEQLLGTSIRDLFSHAKDRGFHEGFERAVQTRQTVSFDAYYPEPLNRWFQCHCYPSKDGLSVYFHDITDRREVEARREQLLAAEQAARSEGERIARAKDEFLASLSHELRTPLAAIVGWVTVLKRPDIEANTVRRGIDAIARNAQAQTHLVNDLLDMSRIISGKLRMNFERVNLNAIATAAADTARLAAQAKNLTIGLRLADAADVEIMGDASRLEQIATNLLTNAVKFTPAGGSVTVSTASTEAHVELIVTDTGQGIKAGFLPHLFDRFSQADGSAARLHGGLGLGLSIVKNLVELHGGSVVAASAGAGLGASFQVRLPRTAYSPVATASAMLQDGQQDVAPEWADTSAHQELDLNGISVLLVDDHVDVLEVQRRLLCEYGATVTTACSGEQALERLGAASFDVLISDLGMPGMDGYALIEQVRTGMRLAAADLPAAAVTAFVRAEDRAQALHHGFQVCIQKPLSPTALARVVHDLVKDKRAGPGNAVEAASRLRALFVEDHADLREQIGWQLEEAGLELAACASAEDALLELANGTFDLIITDVSLPQMSGVELAKRVLAHAPLTWIVFCTGYVLGDRLSDLGPNVRALLKPFEMDELQRVLSEIRAP
ncbi:MAG: response regulator, partial [Burkholderiaceae bacterium]